MLESVSRNFCPKIHKDHTDCAICLSTFVAGIDRVISLPCDTRHFFHAACIQTWVQQSDECPLCKGKFTLPQIEEPSKEEVRAQWGALLI